MIIARHSDVKRYLELTYDEEFCLIIMLFMISWMCVLVRVPSTFSQVFSVPAHLEAPTPNPLYRPKLIIFETDHLLWPFWVDIKVTPPFKKEENGVVTDDKGAVLKPYPEVSEVLKKLTEENITLAVGFRSEFKEETETLLKYFDFRRYFKYVIARARSKRFSFESLRNQSGVELGDMLFFDTESKNVMLWRKTRLPSILCKNGLTLKNVEKGLVKFAKLKRKGLL
ncbi:unnamed protein product [Bemisia tabaci]|uniref:Magnesium-dependent phosphatase 1 n=1 Tax=Bemisia tabaci TaxID=7038 RepID=A0A9P0A1I6_BEMTA|nr:unnamed protein product [Bemisia tabaci]